MKKLFCLWLLLIFSSTKIIAQNNLPPVHEIKTDTAFEQDLVNTYRQLQEDKEGKCTIEQVSALPLSVNFGSA